LENRQKASIPGRVFGAFSGKPDLRAAAKTGSPNMATLHPTVPVSVPGALTGATGVTADVNASVVSDTSALDNGPDARANPSGQNAVTASAGGAQTASAQQPLPTNHVAPPKKQKKAKKPKQPKPQVNTDTTPKTDSQPKTDAPQ